MNKPICARLKSGWTDTKKVETSGFRLPKESALAVLFALLGKLLQRLLQSGQLFSGVIKSPFTLQAQIVLKGFVRPRDQLLKGNLFALEP